MQQSTKFNRQKMDKLEDVKTLTKAPREFDDIINFDNTINTRYLRVVVSDFENLSGRSEMVRVLIGLQYHYMNSKHMQLNNR